MRNVILSAALMAALTIASGPGCSEQTSAPGGSGEAVSLVEAALTAAQCSFFEVEGKVRICHHTGSAKKPYTIIRVSTQACIDGHAAHAGDYIATNPSCDDLGCFPVGAPLEYSQGAPVIPCCEGLRDVAGVCSCPADEACTTYEPDPSTGSCIATPRPATTACGDPTDDECNDPDHCSGTDGTCVDAVAALGAPCGDADGACTYADSCDGAGACVDHGFKPATTACGDPTDDECNDPDHCSGTDGSCVDAVAAAGVACGDAESACVNADACDGAGACTDHGFKPATTACGDPTQDACNAPDHCSGIDGNCVNVVADLGAPCGDAEGPCTHADFCDGLGACLDNGFKPATTACGDPTDDECNHPDHCSGTDGSCVNEVAAAGAACGDAEGACTHADSCDGAGGCTDNGFKALGTACGSSADTDCDNPDSCDGSGSCHANYESTATVCRSAADVCDVAETCDGAGSCPDDGFATPGNLCADNAICDQTGGCGCDDGHVENDLGECVRDNPCALAHFYDATDGLPPAANPGSRWEAFGQAPSSHDGVLTFATTTSGSGGYKARAFADEMIPGYGYRLEGRAQVTAGSGARPGLHLWSFYDGRLGWLNVGPTGLLWGSIHMTTPIDLGPFDNASAPHTFRVDYIPSTDTFSVFRDGVLVADGLLPEPEPPTISELGFGDGTASGGVTADVYAISWEIFEDGVACATGDTGTCSAGTCTCPEGYAFDDAGACVLADACPDDPAKTEPGTCGCGFIDSSPCSMAVTVELYDTATPATELTSMVYDSIGHTASSGAVYVYQTITGSDVGWVPAPYVATMRKDTNRTFVGSYLGFARYSDINLTTLALNGMATVDAATGAVSYGPSPTPGFRVRFKFETMQVSVERYGTDGNPLTSFAYDAAGHLSGPGATYVFHPLGDSGVVQGPFWTTFAKGPAARDFIGYYLGFARGATINLATLASNGMATVDAATGAVSYGPSPSPGFRVRFVYEMLPVTVEHYDPDGNPLTSFVYDAAGHLSGPGATYVFHPLGDSGVVPTPFWTTFARGPGARDFYGYYLGFVRGATINLATLASNGMATVDAATGTVSYGPSPAPGARVRFIYKPSRVTVETFKDGAAVAGSVYIYHPLGDVGWVPAPFWTTFSTGPATRSFIGNSGGVVRSASIDLGQLLQPYGRATVVAATGGVTYDLLSAGVDPTVRFDFTTPAP